MCHFPVFTRTHPGALAHICTADNLIIILHRLGVERTVFFLYYCVIVEAGKHSRFGIRRPELKEKGWGDVYLPNSAPFQQYPGC